MQVDRAESEEENGWYVGLPTTYRGNGRDGPIGGGDLCRPLPEHRCTIHCD